MDGVTQFQHWLLENEAILRSSAFVILILIFVALEKRKPARLPDKTHRYRRLNNFLLLGLNIMTVRLLLPLALFDVALFAAENKIGFFNILPIPLYLNVILTFIIFDLMIYIQHVITHKVGFLWRIHRVHHADIEVDVTTGIRFHPFEIVLSLLYKMSLVVVMGPVAFAIVLYEIMLNGAALFTHSNIVLHKKIERGLRRFFVTPAMHRIHHSAIKQETDSNFGNILSLWDKLFKTYRAVPAMGYDKMRIGLAEFRQPASDKIVALLKIPFTTAGKL